MKITVVAEKDRWDECKNKFGEQPHDIKFVTCAGEVMGNPELIVYLGDDEVIREEILLLQEHKCPILCGSLIWNPSKIDCIIIRFNGWPGFLSSEILEAATEDEHKQVAGQIFEELGWKFRWVPNVIGLVSARIIAAIVNEAYYALGEEVGGKTEINTAMRLGTNYPKGPFEFAEQIGIKNIFVLLSKLSEIDIRYIPAPQLIYESENSWR